MLSALLSGLVIHLMKATTLLLAVPALAAASVVHVPRTNPTPLSAASIASFKPYSFFASAGYCAPSTTLAWDCGSNCNALQGFIPTASGGDGDDVQFWFVGYYPALKSVLVVHQGTDPSQFEALVNDADVELNPLDTTLFPGVSSDVEVHSGFSGIHAATASTVLSAVQKTLEAHKASRVATVGHSLGAALAILDALFLRIHLPATTSVKFVGYGTPRVGNPAWADLVDSRLADVSRVNNKKDFVPILPGRFLGYAHPAGEIHIQDSGAWVACALPDDTTTGCTNDEVSNIFDGAESDHDGPYDGVEMGC